MCRENVIVCGSELPCYFLFLLNNKLSRGQVAIQVAYVQSVGQERGVKASDLIVTELEL